MKRKREDCTHAAPMTGGAEPYRGWREGGVRGGGDWQPPPCRNIDSRLVFVLFCPCFPFFCEQR